MPVRNRQEVGRPRSSESSDRSSKLRPASFLPQPTRAVSLMSSIGVVRRASCKCWTQQRLPSPTLKETGSTSRRAICKRTRRRTFSCSTKRFVAVSRFGARQGWWKMMLTYSQISCRKAMQHVPNGSSCSQFRPGTRTARNTSRDGSTRPMSQKHWPHATRGSKLLRWRSRG
jgi:hypothetical protein